MITLKFRPRVEEARAWVKMALARNGSKPGHPSETRFVPATVLRHKKKYVTGVFGIHPREKSAFVCERKLGKVEDRKQRHRDEEEERSKWDIPSTPTHPRTLYSTDSLDY
jgi:hypothetical protein